MPQVPTHPANQQGLGAPQGQSPANPYYQPNAGLQAAQAQQVNAQTAKVNAENALMQQAAQQQGLQAGPQITPQQVQAEQMADAIVQGQLGQEQIGAMIQAGEVDPGVAEAAVGMAQQMMQVPQGQGLGQF